MIMSLLKVTRNTEISVDEGHAQPFPSATFVRAWDTGAKNAASEVNLSIDNFMSGGREVMAAGYHAAV